MMSVPSATRVLIVDDDATIRELLGSVLRRRDLIVDEATDGAEALVLLRENSYSVVLLDLLMPNVDGFGVIENLGSAISSPVVLVITGADRALLRKLDPRRIHGVVNKPFDTEELAALVVACAEIKSRSPFEAMAISAMIAGGPFLAWLKLP
ncbi:MAG TPA: response regulator [Thermoanaerobaculia bacterium]|nr:response regulator [Thermoanaerobaculia bacterium]